MKGDNQIATTGKRVSASYLYSGPIPDASQLAKYEETLPGAADRILKMAEKQSLHRQEMEKKTLDAAIKRAAIGQIMAFTIAITVIIGGIILLILGKQLEGFASLIFALISLVGLFIYKQESDKQELKEKGKEFK